MVPCPVCHDINHSSEEPPGDQPHEDLARGMLIRLMCVLDRGFDRFEQLALHRWTSSESMPSLSFRTGGDLWGRYERYDMI